MTVCACVLACVRVWARAHAHAAHGDPCCIIDNSQERAECANSSSGSGEEQVGMVADRYQNAWVHLADLPCIDTHIQRDIANF